jgi:hypothetical protein
LQIGSSVSNLTYLDTGKKRKSRRKERNEEAKLKKEGNKNGSMKRGRKIHQVKEKGKITEL